MTPSSNEYFCFCDEFILKSPDVRIDPAALELTPSPLLSPLSSRLCLSLGLPSQPSTPLHRPSPSAARASHKWVRAPGPALGRRSCQTTAVLSASTRPRTWTLCRYTSWTAYSNTGRPPHRETPRGHRALGHIRNTAGSEEEQP